MVLRNGLCLFLVGVDRGKLELSFYSCIEKRESKKKGVVAFNGVEVERAVHGV